mmetsp:Transcript_15227/g.45674  ORF Transcript_15227/g.45674 Transcript_15227/m.45674 type:complete len:123 (+) Transcript_15227:742-1110(+)
MARPSLPNVAYLPSHILWPPPLPHIVATSPPTYCGHLPSLIWRAPPIWWACLPSLAWPASAREQEMAARDDLEGEIDGKMVALFNRLKQLEDANLMLEQDNESLKGKLGQPEEKPAAPVNAD